MRAVDIIKKKRDGDELSMEEIDFFIRGYTDGSIPDYQAAAWMMAIYFKGMSDAEATALTMAMAGSGQQLNPHKDLPAGTVVVDKHSTGGVGDKTSLVLTPLIAGLGLPVGKLSGRGLGFSGGTIDKLESISGFNVNINNEQFVRQLHDIGLVLGGQTADLAPADGKLYALRDVTATVPSLPLIASSIMSKKLATGADAIVLDVKVGRGAFMQSIEEAQHLARLMVEIGKGAGRGMAAVLSDMNQPLGRAVGNALELKEAIETLHGRGPADFTNLVVVLAAEMLRLGGAVDEQSDPFSMIMWQLESGDAWLKFRQFVHAQGGDVGQIDNPDKLPAARLVSPLEATESGWLAELNADTIGAASVLLGGGRQKKGDAIDPAVGIVLAAKIGDQVEAGHPLCWIHANDEERLEEATKLVRGAMQISDEPVSPPSLVLDIIR
ncbi:MAG: thymidine phosphorylase [Anaerolineae bacterium]|nr:thymidine phosphorylase [Anaerolineae bacterium]